MLTPFRTKLRARIAATGAPDVDVEAVGRLDAAERPRRDRRQRERRDALECGRSQAAGTAASETM